MTRLGTEQSLFHRIPGDREHGRTGINAGGMLEKFWEQQGKLNTGKCEWSRVLFRVVNRRPGDECLSEACI